MSSCPKCFRPASDTDVACARCGLLRSRFATFNVQIPPHPILDPLWQEALGDWDEPQRHGALSVAAAHDVSILSALTQRYSAVLRERPDDPVAKKAVAHLVHLALSLPVPTHGATEASAIQNIVKGAIGILMMIAAVLLLAYITRK